ncbi:hypothetical protein BT63DRAFT_314226 [Microthyrium microscopicum]|uniref:SAGA complex subunit Spt7 n=1 Tax=Microthyrium microscopicum TaxID=703497 RepID=A0A6A6U3E2_9PEZI|nr:hypothetical protein BT63DRAFT_314226 [Microthyrium microscopicum]
MNPHLSPFASSRNGSHGPNYSATHAYQSSKLRARNSMTDDTLPGPGPPNGRVEHTDGATEDDPRVVAFRTLFSQSEARLNDFLKHGPPAPVIIPDPAVLQSSKSTSRPVPSSKKPTRAIDEDDYGDDDEDEEEDEAPAIESPLLPKSTGAISRGYASPARLANGSPVKPPLLHRPSAASEGRSTEDARKKAQQDKQAAEEAAKRNFHTMFYTFEHDRAAMLEQQKLDELDRQVEAEVSGDRSKTGPGGNTTQQGSLSSANLGASSLMLKHLLSRIDKYRYMVNAQDSQLRRLISEVRKNRSKWASEEKVGQEELYEAAEKVLQELKANTEQSGPFLNRVNKRDAPDYYTIIKHPMDIGTMLKKLKNFAYKSKKEFVDDLNLIWSNCLKYNTDPNHFLRKKALYMQKQTESLVFLIPDIVIRDRAEVEAEERKMQNLDAELDGLDDSDDEPIMASRGRKAPSKAKKGTSTARKAPPAINEGTPGPETKPNMSHGSSLPPRNGFPRAESDAPMEGIINGFSTPPPGTHTPLGMNGVHMNGTQSQGEGSEVDGAGFSLNDLSQGQEMEYADLEFRTWKQVTKKPRAVAAADRKRLFINHRINPEEPALLRSKAGMRRYIRLQKQIQQAQDSSTDSFAFEDKSEEATDIPGETLAEGVEAAEDDNILPDYYDPVSAVPDIPQRLRWELDAEGKVKNQDEESMHVVPAGLFVAPPSIFGRKMDANIHLMQETRKVCSKIGVVKQMQLQTQMYSNQFQKYDPRPFMEKDIDTTVVSTDLPILAPEVCRATFQRSIGKVFYHAGFEEFHPSALEVATDFMADHFQRLIRTFADFANAPKHIPQEASEQAEVYEHRYTMEDALLHTFNEHAIDLDGLDSYVKDDVERLSLKLGVMNDRMKANLADLLRPALDPSAGADGVGAFNDGSDQFVNGDFAGDIAEDFFGFKELGLDKELGLPSLSVPFHLLHNRMHNAFVAQNQNSSSLTGDSMEQPEAFDPMAKDIADEVIDVARKYFLERLQANNGQPLVEDDDLPPKQRFPKPRLPPNGKITSPRKRPIREQQQLAKKKRKLEEGREETSVNGVVTGVSGGVKPLGKLKLDAPPSNPPMADPEKEDEAGALMSPPESM